MTKKEGNKGLRFPRIPALYFFIVLVIVFLSFLAYRQIFSAQVITTDTTLTNFHLSKHKTVTVKNGATVVLEGPATIDGIIRCENGELSIDATDELIVTGTIVCNREETDITTDGPLNGIVLIIRGRAVFTKESYLVSNAHVQIVESPDLLLTTPEEFKNVFFETAADTGEGFRIGTLFGQTPPQAYHVNIKPLMAINNAYPSETSNILGDQDMVKDKGISFKGKIGMSVGHPDEPFPGWIDLKKVPKYLDYILIWAAMPNGVLDIEDAYMFTPDGHDGHDIIGGCDINVPESESPEDTFKRNAMRLRGHAKVLRIRNFYLYLGSGGKGGDAVTDKNCDPCIAVFGLVGNPSNLKFTTKEAIEILGGFYIYPGRGGNGGKAIAYGRDGIDGCENREAMNGADTFATGGNGAANPRVLRAQGNVQGLQNIFIGSIYGGDGGDAEVHPGKGGDANKCDCPGGKGGRGVATPGKGGQVSLRVPAGVQRTEGSEDVVGKDGFGENAVGSKGVDGPKCPKGMDQVNVTTPQKDTTSTTATASDNKSGFFEFIDLATGENMTNSAARQPHIIVASSGSPDIQNLLPITLRLTVDGQQVWTGTISGDPSVVCRGATGCSVDGPQIPGDFTNLTLSAYDKDGMLIATFTQ